MKAVLSILNASAIVILLACAGCEPEPQAQPSTEVMQQEVTEIPESVTQAEPVTEEMPEKTEEVEDITEAIPAETATETEQPEEQQAAPDENNVAVTVNGTEITAAQVDELIQPNIQRLNQQYSNREHDDIYKNIVKGIRQKAIDALITMTLIQQQMDKENIDVTEQEINEYIEGMAANENMTVDDLKVIVTRGGGTFEQWKERMQLDKLVGVVKLIEAQNFGSLDVNESDARQYYQNNERRYKQPEQVEASHILIKPDTSDPNIDPNQADADARAKAEELLKQIKAGADFAELARKHSACPSSVNGGNLGFGSRRKWVSPFSQAAFALQPGQISDVVKTSYGYHIIKVTGRKDAAVTSFEEAKDDIMKMKKLKVQKERKVGKGYIDYLRKNAQIEYSP